MMTGTFMAILDVFIVLVAAPAIQADLHTNDATVQLVLAGYQLTYAVSLITAGRLGDLYGRRRLFLTGMTVFTLASALCGAAPTASILIVARLVQGLGAALMFPQVFTMITALVPAENRPRAFGVLGAVIGASTIVGQVLGGLLIHLDLVGTSWRPVFWINVPIGATALVLARRRVPETRASAARRLDLPGVLVLTVAVFLLVIPLIEGREVGWALWIWGCLALSAAAFTGFVAVERRIHAAGWPPLVPPALFRQRPFAVGIVVVILLYAALNSFFLILSLTLQDGLGLSALDAGLIYAPQAVAFFGCSLLAGRLTRRYGHPVLKVGAAVTTVGFSGTIAVALIQGGQMTPTHIIPTLVVQGIGQGLLLTPLLNQILSRIRADDTGAASGVLSTAQQVGGAFGVTVIGVVYFSVLGNAATHHPGAYAHALGIAALVNLILSTTVTALLFALPRDSPTPRSQPDRHQNETNDLMR
jgi:EmrB/QacA subfamily drug resistance transporter